MRMIPLFALLIVLCVPSATLAGSPNPQRGKEFAQANCARCHSIDRSGNSPRDPAPQFRELHNRYPVETLEESLDLGGSVAELSRETLAQLDQLLPRGWSRANPVDIVGD